MMVCIYQKSSMWGIYNGFHGSDGQDKVAFFLLSFLADGVSGPSINILVNNPYGPTTLMVQDLHCNTANLTWRCDLGGAGQVLAKTKPDPNE